VLVTEADNKLVGIITTTDLLALLDQLLSRTEPLDVSAEQASHHD